MSQDIEFIGKNVDKALEKASSELNMPIEKLRYDVVSYGSSGIFGLVGAKKAKILVKNPDDGINQSDARAQARDLVKDAFQLEDDQEIPTQDLEPAVTVGTEALKRIVDAITKDTTIESETGTQRILYKVGGGNSGLLIGKRGQTLEAIQYLVEKIVNKQTQQRIRVLVDVEGYLKTRKINLQKLATKMAEKAKRTQKPVTIGQMNAYDRRTVHLHLKSNNAVRTQSVGEGYYRKLIVFPKKRRRNRQNNQKNA
ncbi:MAG: RNA-binding cell elongation regulator Jag/EloR [Desulfobacteraceae bacterium]|jgi:spoIIIJ-associated protein